MTRNIVLMNFTHVYEKEAFTGNARFRWIDCTDLSGTSGYCDPEACTEITKRIAKFSPEGIHFIDSGNYHYISKLWTDMIRQRFSLIVFDHHPDMQPPLFSNILSCGSWVKDMLDTNRFLDRVVIAGADMKLAGQSASVYGNRVKIFSERYLSIEQGWQNFSHLHIDGPVYISVDKDVLDTESASTDWDQGSLPLKSLEELLATILKNEDVIGVDICGECSRALNYFEEKRNLEINGRANAELLALFLRS